MINESRKKKPFFSIITVVKNDEKNILKTVKSILNQSYKNYEYIIIDGKSTDNTINEINKIDKINKISKILSEKDKGIYDAMNKGIKLSKGEVIVYVNSGDKFKKKALQIIKNKFDINEKISFVFGTVIRHYTKKVILKSGFNFNRILYNFDFATSHTVGFFLKKKVYKKLGFYDTRFKCSADYDLYYRLYKLNLHGLFTNKKEIIGEVASGGHSSKLSFFEHLIEETKIRIKNRQNLILIIIIFLNAILKNISKIF